MKPSKEVIVRETSQKFSIGQHIYSRMHNLNGAVLSCSVITDCYGIGVEYHCCFFSEDGARENKTVPECWLDKGHRNEDL